MKKKLHRNKPLFIYVTEEEKKKILNNMKRANAKTITNYVRELALNEGEIIIYNFSELKDSLSETGKYVYELNKIGNNVNQIAKKVNESDVVATEDVQYLLSQVEQMKSNYETTFNLLLKELNRVMRSN
ncbi:plasmid mobilization relaxosome protein MobC [Lactococcus lactis subsp. lactis]|uniref:Plasmid mobilization relaxosome protein MobC n=2 Tax=Lactococcus lactis TaxID=1358 RepID=A0AAE4NPM2_9LACT|nr:plasmid mobilization relaxosome protein MobC [Lactococcus lactis]MCI2096063.1 MobC family plasmid mobilization relaxosome protein [Lactococcus lactis]MCI2139292.1 MobC family plasmid mobilization relaxosome protein [Lactococcus lactis]MCI2190399.1 MobC family plasmid mobilization relaxosome protein [Lactococcus lactis]MCM6847493.1 MobC family plasmid mobilization relaxosome protein [Lactococcus lactis]MCU5754510.1 MobC family plasmid mobilization relaxosome protein [Lactococcus lactis]